MLTSGELVMHTGVCYGGEQSDLMRKGLMKPFEPVESGVVIQRKYFINFSLCSIRF